ncbi:tyrosine-type recombinase/integrase [Dactylosporangium sp. CA-052675]|uniref:tyrosine-type recombinase/integrase n=1 Tax=Dactylosporangium sp. CA-052675 TaxID=3239927 RepID=UPI003D8A5031
MTTVDIGRLTARVPPLWAGLIRDWDRTLRAGNYPATTRYGYLLAAVQLGRYLNDPESAANDGSCPEPGAVTKRQIEDFQAWMIATRSATTALTKHKSLQQFFRWLLDEEEIVRDPMARVRQPKTPKKLIPVMADDEMRRVLRTCATKGFIDLRDEAIIRMLSNTGARLSEIANLAIDDVDLDTDVVHIHGKGAKDRRVRIGPKTGRAVSRYLRVRSRRKGAELAELWLAERGGVPLAANGVKIMLRRRGERAGVEHVHAHRWRHTYAHEWKLAGGDTGDLMLLLGWASDEMPRHYGASAAAERAQVVQARMRIGERV